MCLVSKAKDCKTNIHNLRSKRGTAYFEWSPWADPGAARFAKRHAHALNRAGGEWRGCENFTLAGSAAAQAIEVEVHDWGRKQREHLAEDQPADDGDAERAAQLRADAAAQGQRQAA